MVVNVIGECDNRPILYCCMKVLQEFGDVLLVTSSNRLLRLSDTQESSGHYQNTMICVTHDGIDDFFDQLRYDRGDFDYIIIDNVVTVESDITLYVEGMSVSETESYLLSMLDEYQTIRLYKDKLIEASTAYKIEQFEALRDMCPMTPKVINAVCKLLSPKLGVSADKLVKIANAYSGAGATKSVLPISILGTKKNKK